MTDDDDTETPTSGRFPCPDSRRIDPVPEGVALAVSDPRSGPAAARPAKRHPARTLARIRMAWSRGVERNGKASRDDAAFGLMGKSSLARSEGCCLIKTSLAMVNLVKF